MRTEISTVENFLLFLFVRFCQQPSRTASSISGDNDPSAGSPTETLLRLFFPLNDMACTTSQILGEPDPKNSPNHSIGKSDGRCVQRAGT
jgi:hypothetical protein